MKIAFFLPKFSTGGAERVISKIANHLSDKHEVQIVLTNQFNQSTFKLLDSIEVIDLTTGKSNDSFFKRVMRIRKLIKNGNIDFAISFLLTMNIQLLFSTMFVRKSKIIISERNDPYNIPADRKKRVLRRFLYGRAHKVVFQSEEAMKYYDFIKNDKKTVIYNPINVMNYKTYITEPNDRRNVIYTVGRFSNQKNYLNLLDEMSYFLKHNDSYEFHIYGDGELKSDIESKIKELDLEDKIVLKGVTKSIEKEINNNKIFVLGSSFEGFPNVLVEAISLEIPFVINDFSPYCAKSVLSNKGGYVINLNTNRDLSSNLEILLKEMNYIQKVVECSEVKNKFDEQLIFKLWSELLDS